MRALIKQLIIEMTISQVGQSFHLGTEEKPLLFVPMYSGNHRRVIASLTSSSVLENVLHFLKQEPRLKVNRLSPSAAISCSSHLREGTGAK